MKNSFIFILAWSRGHSAVGLSELFTHAIVNVIPCLLRIVLSWTRICLHFKRIDVWLDTSCIFWAGISKVSMLILSWTWLLNLLAGETVILWDGPKGCLKLIFGGRIVNIWPWYVT